MSLLFNIEYVVTCIFELFPFFQLNYESAIGLKFIYCGCNAHSTLHWAIQTICTEYKQVFSNQQCTAGENRKNLGKTEIDLFCSTEACIVTVSLCLLIVAPGV